MNPRQMKSMMKKMGIKQVEIPASEVIIKTDEKEIVITDPQVSKVNMMGQQTYQVIGEAEERPLTPETSTEPKELEISDEDVQTVVDQTGVDKQTVLEKIKEHQGDLAAAILALKSEKQDAE